MIQNEEADFINQPETDLPGSSIYTDMGFVSEEIQSRRRAAFFSRNRQKEIIFCLVSENVEHEGLIVIFDPPTIHIRVKERPGKEIIGTIAITLDTIKSYRLKSKYP